MKRQIHSLLALLFIISTLTTSLHELMPHHDSSNCQICTLVQNDNGLTPDNTIELTKIALYYESLVLPNVHYSYQQISTLQARAPPSFS